MVVVNIGPTTIAVHGQSIVISLVNITSQFRAAAAHEGVYIAALEFALASVGVAIVDVLPSCAVLQGYGCIATSIMHHASPFRIRIGQGQVNAAASQYANVTFNIASYISSVLEANGATIQGFQSIVGNAFSRSHVDSNGTTAIEVNLRAFSCNHGRTINQEIHSAIYIYCRTISVPPRLIAATSQDTSYTIVGSHAANNSVTIGNAVGVILTTHDKSTIDIKGCNIFIIVQINTIQAIVGSSCSINSHLAINVCRTIAGSSNSRCARLCLQIQIKLISSNGFYCTIPTMVKMSHTMTTSGCYIGFNNLTRSLQIQIGFNYSDCFCICCSDSSVIARNNSSGVIRSNSQINGIHIYKCMGLGAVIITLTSFLDKGHGLDIFSQFRRSQAFSNSYFGSQVIFILCIVQVIELTSQGAEYIGIIILSNAVAASHHGDAGASCCIGNHSIACCKANVTIFCYIMVIEDISPATVVNKVDIFFIFLIDEASLSGACAANEVLPSTAIGFTIIGLAIKLIGPGCTILQIQSVFSNSIFVSTKELVVHDAGPGRIASSQAQCQASVFGKNLVRTSHAQIT